MTEWISVKDRLPEIPKGLSGVNVIVAEYDPCCKEYTVHECMFGYHPKNDLWPASEKNDFMVLYLGKETFWGPAADIITHWIPIPEPPTELPDYIIECEESNE